MKRTANLATLLLGSIWALPALALPEADALLTSIGFSGDTKARVLKGELVTASLASTSEREVATAIAFFVKEPPATLIEDAKKHLMESVDPDSLAHGTIRGDGTLADFERVALGSDSKKQAKAYADAKPGEDLNLSSSEIAAFDALGAASGDASAVEAQIRKLLLERHRAYRAKGLDGIAPYARAGGAQTDVAGDLRRAVEAAKGLDQYAPDFVRSLLDYPNSRPAALQEEFQWSHYVAHGTPVFLLKHRTWMPEGGGFAIAQRQFYVSASYNAVQELAAILPMSEGALVVYLNRTSTDQVAGFGGSTKRAMGDKLMTSQIEGLFEKARAAAQK